MVTPETMRTLIRELYRKGADEEEIEGFGGLYSFTLPEDLDETEKVTITIFKF